MSPSLTGRFVAGVRIGHVDLRRNLDPVAFAPEVALEPRIQAHPDGAARLDHRQRQPRGPAQRRSQFLRLVPRRALRRNLRLPGKLEISIPRLHFGRKRDQRGNGSLRLRARRHHQCPPHRRQPRQPKTKTPEISHHAPTLPRTSKNGKKFLFQRSPNLKITPRPRFGTIFWACGSSPPLSAHGKADVKDRGPRRNGRFRRAIPSSDHGKITTRPADWQSPRASPGPVARRFPSSGCPRGPATPARCANPPPAAPDASRTNAAGCAP